MSAHTNLDSAPHGLNDLLAEKLKLKFVHPLIAAKEDKTHQAGLGRVGRLPKLLFSEFLDFLSFQLKLKQFRYVGDLNKLISTVAVMSGSGGDFYHHAKLKKADVLVSGDVKYHAALDALGEGICLVDIGHFAGEFGMVSLIANQIRQFLKKQRVFIPVTETLVQQDPFSFRINS